MKYYYILDGGTFLCLNYPIPEEGYAGRYQRITERQYNYWKNNPWLPMADILACEISEESIEDYKQQRIFEVSNLAFELRKSILPDYKILNASLDIYVRNTADSYADTIQAFRDEFYRIKAGIIAAKNIQQVDLVLDGMNFPTQLR
jgi:hypothetical protein